MTVNPHVWRRLSWRVPIIMLCWLVPTFIGMGEEEAKPLRDVCLAALAVAFSSWFSKQGTRKKPEGRGDG